MATLRDPLFRTSTVTKDDLDALAASGMGSLRRGYETGRLATQANELGAQVSSLRADGNAAKADALSQEIANLQRQQEAYAPEVGRVEDIHGLGDAGSWLAGQVGQGAASMQDQVAAGTTLTGVGGLLRRAPNAGLRTAGMLLQNVAAPAAEFGINQRQLKGGFYNDVARDPEIMRNYNAQQINNTANAYGAGAGAMATVLPTVVARQLGGAELGGALPKIGAGQKLGMELMGGGAIGAAQDAGAMALRSHMNPDRDTRGDAMDLVNSFAGGVAGPIPFVGAGAAVEHASHRIGHAADAVSKKAGETVDLLGEKAAPYVEKGKDKLGNVIDMFRSDGGDGGDNVTPESINDKAVGTAQDLKAKLDEHELMKGVPPADIVNDDDAFNAWYTENEPKRRDAVLNRLADLADTGDEKATNLYTQFSQAKTQGEQDQIINEGAEHVLSQNEWTELEEQARAHAEKTDGYLSKIGGALGKGARAVGEAAIGVGKAAVDGFNGKKNMQVDPSEQVPADQALEGGKQYVDGLKEQAERQKSYQRAKVMSEFLASEAKSAMEGRGYGQSTEDAINVSPSMADRVGGTRMPSKSPEAMTGFMKDIGLEIADLSENWITPRPAKAEMGNAPTGPMSTLKQSADSRGQQYDGLQLSMNRIVNSLRVMYKDRAGDVINELQSMVDPKAAPMFDVMREELETQQSPSGMRHTDKVRKAASDALISTLGQDTEARLLDEGVNLRTEDGKESLRKMVEAVDLGIAPPHAAKALEGLIGKENLLNLRRTIRPRQASREDLIEDDGRTVGEGLKVDGDSGEVSVAEQSNFDKRQAANKVDRTSAPRMYGFKGTSTVRTSEGAKRDPFAPEGRISFADTMKAEDEMLQRAAEDRLSDYTLPKGLRRPALSKVGEKTFDGRDASEVARARLSKLVGGESNDQLARNLLQSDNPKEVNAGEQAKGMLDQVAADKKAVAGIRENAKAAKRDLTQDEQTFIAEATQHAAAVEKKLAPWRQRMFGDQSRGGEWDVQTRNVLDVLKEEGADDSRILSLYRDYARMEMVAAKDPAERAKFQRITALLRPAIVDQIDKKSGKSYAPRLSEAEHANMMRLAERYFGERTMAVAEQHTDRTPEKLSAAQVTTLASFGKSAMSFADRIGREQGENAKHEYIADRNLIQFAGNDGKSFHIPAGRLVLWGKKELGQYFEPAKTDAHDNYTRNLEYLAALTLGINAVRESGMVALTKTGEGKYVPGGVSIADKFGRMQKFRADAKAEPGGDRFNGLPDNLMLATTNVFGFKKMMSNRKIKPTSEQQDLLTKLREWNDEPFVSAQNEGAEGVAPEQLWGTLGGAMKAAGTTRLTPENDMSRSVNQTPRVSTVDGVTRTTEGNDLVPSSKIKPLEAAASRPYKSTNDGGLDSKGQYQPGATPSDFDGANPERAEHTRANRETGFDAAAIPDGLGAERRIDAGKKAAARGQQIVEALDSNFDDGMKSLDSRMRMAKAPEFNANDPNTVRGGAHYALPVLEALSDENLSKMDIDAEQASKLTAIRKEAQALVKNSDLSNTVKAAYVEGFTPPTKAVKDMTPRQLIDATVALDKETTANSDRPALKGRLAVKALGTIDEQEANAAKIHELREKYASTKGSMTEKQRGMMDILFRRMSQAHEIFMPTSSAKEVGARLGKPDGADKVELTGTSRYLSKDQDKSDRANKFIGRGSDTSSTATYAKDWGDRANTGAYSARDRVFISAEGNRDGRVAPDFAEISKAMAAGATLITDNKANRERPYNVGEREVASHLTKHGYIESEPGVWEPGKPAGTKTDTKFNRQSQDIHDDLGREGFAATHDSPHRHEGEFDWRAHIGEGEGNAAFGAGTYLSTADGVHSMYKNQFTAMSNGPSREEMVKAVKEKEAQLKELQFAADPANWIPSKNASSSGRSLKGDAAGERGSFTKISDIRSGNEQWFAPWADRDSTAYGSFEEAHKAEYADGVEHLKREVASLQARIATYQEPVFDKSPTYQVSVNIKPERLLDWNKPLREQTEFVQKALHKMLDDESLPSKTGGVGDIAAQRELSSRTFPETTGRQFYGALAKSLGSQAAASDYLQKLGILGHRYAAGGRQNSAHPNFVVYDDSKITTNYVHFNKQDETTPESTRAERDAAVAEIVKTVGKDIGVRFEQTTGFSGAYLDKEAAIVISTTPAAGTLQTTYHEALHAFVARLVKGNEKAQRVLDALANHEPTMERVVALLDGYPEAIAQLKDGEERIAYTYQFWRAGLLDLPTPEATTMLQKLRKFFRATLGQVTDLERGGDLLRAFAKGSYAGDPSVAGKVIAKHLSQGAWGAKTLRKMDGLVQHVAALIMPARSVLENSKSKTAQKLSTQFWTNPGDSRDADKGEGYLNARDRMARRYSNEFSRIMASATERDHADVLNYLQKETDSATIPYAPHREAVEKIRALLRRFREYMVDERGMDIGDHGPLYFPRVWSAASLQTNHDAFIKMMTKEYPSYNAEGVYNALINRYSVEGTATGEGAVDDAAVLKPTHGAGNERILDAITGEHAAPFLEKSLVGTLTRYFHEGARAAEYTSRFGQNGEILAATLGQIHQELRAEAHKMRKDGVLMDQNAETKWADRQMRDIRRSVDAMEGTLGGDISEGWRKAGSWMTVYQNARLLPLALFSNVIDPLGMMGRGAPMKEAFDAFLQGMHGVFKNWKGMLTGKEGEAHMPDEWERLAMAVGSVDAAVFNHHVSSEYASIFMSPGARKINGLFFKANGMESWNRGMRVAATRSAVNFILRHRTGAETHSLRWLEEIGLTPKDIHVDPEGRLITDKHILADQLGITKNQAAENIEKVHAAINRWVQGAIITPNAAQRPAWASDPHWSMFFLLKQFSYSFQQTIMKRAVKELEYGNIAPMGAFIWYVPVMIASDLLRGLIQGGGKLPASMQGLSAGDYMRRGIERSGLLSVGQIGVDADRNLASLGGPAVEQIIDSLSDPLKQTLIKAAPAHGLYAEALR